MWSRAGATASSTCAPTPRQASGPTVDFFLWKITERYADLGELGAALNGTPLAGWLETPYSYLATTKASPYTEARRPRKIIPKGSPYLVVYPFVKVRPWYALPLEDRQRAMDEHIRIGREFETIHNHTTYSFGIDDQEFMTAFECDEPSDFMHLMLTLRESEASAYTERDTPIFVGEGMADPRRARRPRRRLRARPRVAVRRAALLACRRARARSLRRGRDGHAGSCARRRRPGARERPRPARGRSRRTPASRA